MALSAGLDAIDKIFANIHVPPGRVGNTGSKALNMI